MTGITPDRKTIVTLDSPDVYASERTVFIHRNLDEIAEITAHKNFAKKPDGIPTGNIYNVAYMTNKGWMLGSQLHGQCWQFEVAGGIGWNTTMAGAFALNMYQRHRYRANDDLPGVSLGTDQQTTGYEINQREVSAGGSFDQDMSEDRSAYPAASMPEVQPLRRMFVSTENSEPTDHLLFHFEAPAGNSGPLVRLYFTSLAGNYASDGNKRGTGQYHLTIHGHGLAVLHERLYDPSVPSYSWTERYRFPWKREMLPAGHYIQQTLTIYSDATRSNAGTYSGENIMFNFYNYFDDPTSIKNVDLGAPGRTDIPTYKVMGSDRYQPMLEKVRLDERRDIRSIFRIERSRFYFEGQLQSNTVDVQYMLGGDEPLYVEWFGQKPAGTSIEIKCFDGETDIELGTFGSEVHHENYGYKGFMPTNGKLPDTDKLKYRRTKYYARVKLKSPSGTVSPLINGLRFSRNPVFKTTEQTPVVLKTVQSISVTGQDSDPTHESAMIRCADLTDELTLLQTRANMPVKVDIQYDPIDPTKISTLFTGYVAQATRTVAGGKRNRPYPADRWAHYDLRCTGEWQRLMEAKTSHNFDFGKDANRANDQKALPWTVTNIIRTLIADAGYEDENIIVPEIEMRLFGNGDPHFPFMLEAYNEIFPVVAKYALTYLGGWLVWDANATHAPAGTDPIKMGAWRLMLPPKPNSAGHFNYLAHFKFAPSLDPGTRLRHRVSDQKDDTTIVGQTIKTVWIKKGSYSSYVVPPEGNMVIVTGKGINLSDMSGPVGAALPSLSLTQAAFNFKSAKFFPDQPVEPDPTNPVYTNGRPVLIYVGDGTLGSQAAVDFFCRRIFDMACQAQKRVSFEAPLLLITDPNDPYQRQPRPLRYGDPVLLQGEKFIVANCNPDYSSQSGGSRSMMALYELFTPSDIDHWKTAGTML